MGINKLWCAFDSDSIPEVDESTMVPYDTMHVELDGLVRMEMAYLLYMLISKKKYFTLVQLNAAIKAFEWPKGQWMPAIDQKVVQGAKAKGSCTPPRCTSVQQCITDDVLRPCEVRTHVTARP